MKDGTQDGAPMLLDGPQRAIRVEVWRILSCSTILNDAQNAPLRFRGHRSGDVIQLERGPETSGMGIKRALAPVYLYPHPLSPLTQEA